MWIAIQNAVGARQGVGGGPGPTPPPYTPPLDTYTGAAAAYSVRLLSTAYKTGGGMALRVRRTVAPFDEQDIGFTAGGDLDEAAITTFGGSDILTVSRWYDQSGFSRHTSSSASTQPRIYNGASVIMDNGKPAVEFVDGVMNTMDIGYNISNTALSAFTVMRNSGTGRASGIQTTAAAPYRDGWVIACDATLVRTWYDIDGAANYDRVEVAAAGNVQNLSSLILTAPNIDFRVNGGASVTKTNLWASTDPLNIHQWYPDKGATIQEIVVYDDAKNNTDRSGIETNIMTYYGIP